MRARLNLGFSCILFVCWLVLLVMNGVGSLLGVVATLGLVVACFYIWTSVSYLRRNRR